MNNGTAIARNDVNCFDSRFAPVSVQKPERDVTRRIDMNPVVSSCQPGKMFHRRWSPVNWVSSRQLAAPSLPVSDAHPLWERLKIHEAAVLLFAKDPQVSFTNNRAERDLRMSKVKQKISGCFRVSEYAQAYCRISSYLQSMANKGYNPLIAIQIALAGETHKVWGE